MKLAYTIIIRFAFLLSLLSFSITTYAKITGVTLSPSNSVNQGSMVTVNIKGSGKCELLSIITTGSLDEKNGASEPATFSFHNVSLPTSHTFETVRTGKFKVLVRAFKFSNDKYKSDHARDCIFEERISRGQLFYYNNYVTIFTNLNIQKNVLQKLSPVPLLHPGPIAKQPSLWFDTKKQTKTISPAFNPSKVFGVIVPITNQGNAVNGGTSTNKVSIAAHCIPLSGGKCTTRRLPALPTLSPGQSKNWGNLTMFSVNKPGKYKIKLDITPTTKAQFDKNRQLISSNLKQTWSKEITIKGNPFISTNKEIMKQGLSNSKQKNMEAIKQGDLNRRTPEPSSIRFLLESNK